jgi:hypothetical protein
MLIVGIVAVTWLAFIVAFLVVWSRLHANIRTAEGADEGAYVHGQDERSLAEYWEEESLPRAA